MSGKTEEEEAMGKGIGESEVVETVYNKVLPI